MSWLATAGQKARNTFHWKWQEQKQSQKSRFCRACVLIQHEMQNTFSFEKSMSFYNKGWDFPIRWKTHGWHPYFTSITALTWTWTICISSSDSRHKVILSCPVHMCDQKSLLNLRAPHNKSILKNFGFVLKKKKSDLQFFLLVESKTCCTDQIL